MIILDTNIVSALMQQQPDPQVVDWLDRQRWRPAGRRRCGQDLQSRIAHFDVTAANQAAELAAQRKARGRPVDMRDTFIAGIALARRATLATRNVKHFDDLTTPVVNPWALE